MSTTPHRVALWTVPRSVSTAFERAIMQVEGSRVFHEPYGGPFYFGPERRSQRFAARPTDPDQSYARITRELLAQHAGVSLVFSKDMAYYVDRPDLGGVLGAFRHSFLLRDPRRAIPSLHKLSVAAEWTGWDHFDPREAGYAELHRLFRTVTDELGQAPVVVDSDDLLGDPAAMLEAYCQAVGIAFDPGMLEWEAERVPDWDVWSGWHDDAQGSTGFRRREGPAREPPPLESLPGEVRAAIEEALPHYEAIVAHRLVAAGDGRDRGGRRG